ncbi:hypothetical protein C5U48_12930 [Mycolicibacter virginiensis]|uniref:Head-to-tail adaptor n=1 Tax=Mycolicibacter virginiensis TaxID=1795032 RepID=A0A9X7IMJ5_9MYCO|nr:hypothetical protein [Mycolicibacter virginiensis]PQM51823.1 hypothetical protein C5U48_12930 [Mycolicibacter virginiensis]
MPDSAGELVPADVETFTKGRLKGTDPNVAALLTMAVAAARRYCGWHVTPEREDDELVIDGPGSMMLMLPTLRLLDLTSVIEDGRELDLSTLEWSPRGMVRKMPHHRGRQLGWTTRLGGITVKITHGFTTAPDFNAAVLAMVDRISEDFSPSSSIASRLVVGPFEFPQPGVAEGSAFTLVERAILDSYALEKSP